MSRRLSRADRDKDAYLLWNGVYYPIIAIEGDPHLTFRVSTAEGVDTLPSDGISFEFDADSRPRIEFT